MYIHGSDYKRYLRSKIYVFLSLFEILVNKFTLMFVQHKFSKYRLLFWFNNLINSLIA